MSKEQGERLADLASQNSLNVLRAEQVAKNEGRPVTPSMEAVKNEAAKFSGRAADQLGDK
jgi:hypothetical protein